MNKKILLTAYGIVGGFFGEKLGAQCLDLAPKALSLDDSFFVVLFSLSASLIPFVVITAIVIFRMQGYSSYVMSLLFSFAYYLPFQYKAIWNNYQQPNIELSETLTARLLITVAGALLLSGIYYLEIKIYGKIKRKAPHLEGTKGTLLIS